MSPHRSLLQLDLKDRPRQGTQDVTLAIGLMSGTSIDGIDGVLLSIQPPHHIAIQATLHTAFPSEIQKQINALINHLDESAVDLDALGQLDVQLGALYAETANQLKSADPVAVVGCHGQTIRHRPDGKFPFTWQLGNAAVIAQRTDLPVVTDFRSADLAAGGQGAPLAPAFHRAVFASRDETRAVLNLGGIANITHLPAGDHPTVIGFDTGPANTLLDGWCQRHFQQPFDRDGAHAAAGTVHNKLLERLLSDAYFSRAHPKSTGREYFHQAWLARILADHEFAALSPAVVQATLTALTAESVAHQLGKLTPAIDAVYVCGGGIHNHTLMTMLGQRCQIEIRSTAQLGIDPQWVEAAAFAWMAHQTMQRNPSTLPSVTGAAQPTIAGAIYFPSNVM